MSKYRNRSNRSVPILDKQDELFDEEKSAKSVDKSPSVAGTVAGVRVEYALVPVTKK